jgi:serine/threonine protein kinase
MSDPLIGKQLGDYTIQEVLGQGGMARVYKGYDDKLERFAAVKVIDSGMVATESESEYRERFRREARAIAKLKHPNIVGVYQFGEAGQIYYMAMAFIEGQDVRELIKGYNKERTYMPQSQVLRIIRDIAFALDYAHAEGVIHRDVKPSNIMVTPDGQAILMDFGLALTSTEGTIGTTFGSVHYIAPEQAVSSARAVPQSDLYSLGVVLFEMLTGKVPFDDQSTMSVALKHLSDPPPLPTSINPNIPQAVEEVVMKALDKEPRKRYATGMAFARALEYAFQMGDEDTTANLEAGVAAIGAPRETSPLRPSLPRPPKDDALVITDTMEASAIRLQEKDRRKLPLPLLIGGGLAALGVVALLLFFLFNNNNASSADPAATNEPTRIAAATGVPTATRRPTNTPRPSNTARPTNTPRPTSTPRPTATPTEASSASVVSVEPSAEGTPDITIENERAQVTLRYDGDALLMINRTEGALNWEGVTFHRTTARGTTLDFSVAGWGDTDERSVGGGRCLHVWRNELRDPAYRALCERRVGFRALAPDDRGEFFWISDEAGVTFEVRRGDEVLMVCPTARTDAEDYEYQCDVDIRTIR